MLKRKRHSGLTLIELMISMAISMVVILGGIQLYLTVISSSKATHDRNRLTGEMSALMNVITKDIRRAGFWNANTGTADLWINPFTAAATDIRVPANDCIQYAYDLDKDAVVDPNEFTSVRLESGKVQFASVQLANCGAGSSSDWLTATTDELTITTLQFTLNKTCLDVETTAEDIDCSCEAGGEAACQTIRSVDILLEGELSADSGVTEKMQDSVKIRNDRFECGTSCP